MPTTPTPTPSSSPSPYHLQATATLSSPKGFILKVSLSSPDPVALILPALTKKLLTACDNAGREADAWSNITITIEREPRK